ncbi:MAG: hypothetical protein M1815_001525 [Lichina confinis]|nr:MAG: hypothetical protein M1815_001525 [Lichina confinis]
MGIRKAFRPLTYSAEMAQISRQSQGWKDHGIVPVEALSRFFDADPARIWEQPEYETSLQTRLGRSYDVYLSIVERLLKDLKDIKEKLDLDQGEKASHIHFFQLWITNTGTDALSSTRLQEHTIRSTVLCALGPILIELSFGETLERLREREDQVQDDELLTNFRTAKRLQKEITFEYGDQYENVARQCLDCPFDVDEWNLENEDFQKLVYNNIVRPLLEDWRVFNGLPAKA